MTFRDVRLIEPLLRSVAEEGYEQPTPIQAQAIPPVLDGKDLLGIAQTGTGKTAAFVLPILQRLHERGEVPRRNAPHALILAPTRELAAQIGASIKTYGRHLRLTHAVIFGGVGQRPQVQALDRGIDILVATPGRLLDLMGQRHVRLSDVQVFVLDEADRMLDMGFIHDVRKVIAALPKQRQTLFFSATMPPEVSKLADGILTDPVRVEVAPQATTVERIEQRVLYVEQQDKDALLSDLLEEEHLNKVLVFTRTKHRANKVARKLTQRGIRADAIHGNKSQTARTNALASFQEGRTRVLVATDIAARGIDVEDISHVINYDVPVEPESYVHRIGRTARAGAAGTAYTFCAPDEKPLLAAIERVTRQRIAHIEHPRHSENARTAAETARKKPRADGRRQRPRTPKRRPFRRVR